MEPWSDYSARSAAATSVRKACRAGTMQASTAVAISIAATLA
jgi:hypothetical protein